MGLNNCRFLPLGDRALLIEIGEPSIEGINDRVHALCTRLRTSPIQGVTDLVPAYTTLAVHYDPVRVLLDAGPDNSPFDSLVTRVRGAFSEAEAGALTCGRRVEIPVCYGAEWGEDLDELAHARGLTTEQVVQLHCAPDYRVVMLGFTPGFAYLGGLDARIAEPRRALPRTRVPAGSVAIGGEQTGVYPSQVPGGWNLIGRTPLRMFDVTRDPPCLLAPGDWVKFVPITRAQFDEWSGQEKLNPQCRSAEEAG